MRAFRFICRWRGWHNWVVSPPVEFMPFDQGGYRCTTCDAFEGAVARARREAAGLAYVD